MILQPASQREVKRITAGTLVCDVLLVAGLLTGLLLGIVAGLIINRLNKINHKG